jgi:hypothetical protein
MAGLKPERPADAPRQITEETAHRLLSMMERTHVTEPVQRIRNSQIASALLGTIGLALFIVGVENAASDIPVISNAYGSIGVGLSLLAITGVLLQALRGHMPSVHHEDPSHDDAPVAP